MRHLPNGQQFQVTDKWEFIRRPWQIIAIFAGAMVHISIGVMVGLTGIILPSLMNPEPGEICLNEDQAYAFSSMVHAGSLVGSIISGPLTVWKGQRVCLLIFFPIIICSWIIISQTQTFWLLLASRFVCGLLAGIGGVCASNFVLEISHTKLKGRSFAMLVLFRQLGFLCVYIIGSTGLSWRNVSLIGGTISCAIPFALLTFLHDSPRWLATKGRSEEAGESLAFYRGRNKTEIMSELKDILAANKIHAGESIWEQLKLMSEGYMLKVTCLCIYLSIAFHFTGNMATIMYAATIFKSSNTGVNQYMSAIIMGTARLVGALLYTVIADKFSRRVFMTVPLILTGICMTVLGTYFYMQESGRDVADLFWLPLAALIVYSLFLCSAIPSLMISRTELLPNAIRSIGSSVVYMAFSLGGFLISYSFPYMIRDLGSHGTFWLFAVNIAVFVLVIYLFIPETHGKSLEEIEEIVRSAMQSKCVLQCYSPEVVETKL